MRKLIILFIIMFSGLLAQPSDYPIWKTNLDTLTLTPDSISTLLATKIGLDNYPNLDTNKTDDLITSTTFSGDVSGTYNSIAVSDDSHNHIITNIDAFTEAQLETQLSNVTNVFTNNDGALNDDDVSLGDVQAVLTNLNQITTRSHTVLSDIGTNSHTAIDLFITNVADDTSDFKTAFGWGNHASQNYLDLDTYPNTDTDGTNDILDSDFSSNGLMERTGAGTYSVRAIENTTVANGATDIVTENAIYDWVTSLGYITASDSNWTDVYVSDTSHAKHFYANGTYSANELIFNSANFTIDEDGDQTTTSSFLFDSGGNITMDAAGVFRVIDLSRSYFDNAVGVGGDPGVFPTAKLTVFGDVKIDDHSGVIDTLYTDHHVISDTYTANEKVFSIVSGGTEKVYIDEDGEVFFPSSSKIDVVSGDLTIEASNRVVINNGGRGYTTGDFGINGDPGITPGAEFTVNGSMILSQTGTPSTANDDEIYFMNENNADADTIAIYNGTAWKYFISQ